VLQGNNVHNSSIVFLLIWKFQSAVTLKHLFTIKKHKNLSYVIQSEIGNDKFKLFFADESDMNSVHFSGFLDF